MILMPYIERQKVQLNPHTAMKKALNFPTRGELYIVQVAAGTLAL
jgi:hypothetical protein